MVKIIIILLIIGGVIVSIQEAESIFAKIGIGCLALLVGFIAVMSLTSGVGPMTIIVQLIIGLLTGKLP